MPTYADKLPSWAKNKIRFPFLYSQHPWVVAGFRGYKNEPFIQTVGVYEHSGIDINVADGAEIYPPNFCTVLDPAAFPFVMTGDNPTGKMLLFQVGDYIVRYAHLKETFVKPGDAITPFTKVGTIDYSWSFQPYVLMSHVHLDMWRNGTNPYASVDPVQKPAGDFLDPADFFLTDLQLWELAMAWNEGFFFQSTRPQRDRNPIDLVYAGQPSAIGQDADTLGAGQLPFCIFTTDEDGWNAGYRDLEAKATGRSAYSSRIKTVRDLISFLTATDQQAYLYFLANKVFGFAPDYPVAQLPLSTYINVPHVTIPRKDALLANVIMMFLNIARDKGLI